MAFDRTVDEKAASSFYDHAVRSLHELFVERFDLTMTELEDNAFLIHKYGAKEGERLIRLKADEILPGDFVTNLFVKDEVYIGKTPENFKPRMIWSVNKKIKALYGARFNKLAKLMSAYFHSESQLFYVSGATPDQVGKHGCFLSMAGELTESDVSSWDGSMLDVMARVEVYFIRNFVTGIAADDILLEHWSDVRGRKDGFSISMNQM